MKIPRDISGEHLADVLCRKWQYSKVHTDCASVTGVYQN